MSKKEQDMNLIICYTPLQVLIAEKIIEMHPNDEFYGVMVYLATNKKYDYYAERLRKKCKVFAQLLEKQKKGLNKFFFFWKIILQIKKYNIRYIFCASINELFVQSVVSNVAYQNVYSFDDGTANIAGHGVYYNMPILNFDRKLTRLLLNCRHTLQSLKNGVIDCHYTIYPSLPNIITNTKTIQLNPIQNNMLGKLNNHVKKDEILIKVLLGQPLFDNDEFNKKIAEQVIYDYQIDYYFPHPRETYQLDNVQYIDTHLVFEDYFIQNLANQRCIIYTFLSSAVLNIVSFENVEIIALKPKHIDFRQWENILQIFEKAGIQIIDYQLVEDKSSL